MNGKKIIIELTLEELQRTRKAVILMNDDLMRRGIDSPEIDALEDKLTAIYRQEKKGEGK